MAADSALRTALVIAVACARPPYRLLKNKVSMLPLPPAVGAPDDVPDVPR